MQILKPKFWDKKYITFPSLILLPLAIIYQIVFSIKKTISKRKKFPIPTICIGNIYIGGTGKTPLSIKTYEILKELGGKPVIIKKHYKNHKDEVSLMKNYCEVIESKKRSEGIKEAIEKKFSSVILDDGYQDLEIEKDLNIVCFNHRTKIGNGQVIPSGPLRENLNSLKNCDIILLSGNKDFEFEMLLKKYNKNLNFFYYNYKAENISQFKNKKLIAFAGIGDPESFFYFLKYSHLNVVKEIKYPDHYNYQEKDMDYLFQLEKKHNAKLITTEKDYFRINSRFKPKLNFIPIKVELRENSTFNKIIEKIMK